MLKVSVWVRFEWQLTQKTCQTRSYSLYTLTKFQKRWGTSFSNWKGHTLSHPRYRLSRWHPNCDLLTTSFKRLTRRKRRNILSILARDFKPHKNCGRKNVDIKTFPTKWTFKRGFLFWQTVWIYVYNDYKYTLFCLFQLLLYTYLALSFGPKLTKWGWLIRPKRLSFLPNMTFVLIRRVRTGYHSNFFSLVHWPAGKTTIPSPYSPSLLIISSSPAHSHSFIPTFFTNLLSLRQMVFKITFFFIY